MKLAASSLSNENARLFHSIAGPVKAACRGGVQLGSRVEMVPVLVLAFPVSGFLRFRPAFPLHHCTEKFQAPSSVRVSTLLISNPLPLCYLWIARGRQSYAVSFTQI